VNLRYFKARTTLDVSQYTAQIRELTGNQSLAVAMVDMGRERE
jgi:hypothetical protein